MKCVDVFTWFRYEHHGHILGEQCQDSSVSNCERIGWEGA